MAVPYTRPLSLWKEEIVVVLGCEFVGDRKLGCACPVDGRQRLPWIQERRRRRCRPLERIRQCPVDLGNKDSARKVNRTSLESLSRLLIY